MKQNKIVQAESMQKDKRTKGQKDKRTKGQKDKKTWLLVTNLPSKALFVRRVVTLFTQRMQIEEVFRDTKNERYGLALNYCASKPTKHVEILLMIAI